MKKSDVIEYFGSKSAASKALRVSYQSVHQWPEELTERISIRVENATRGGLRFDTKIYEVFNATDEMINYSMGLFFSLNEALNKVRYLPPDKWPFIDTLFLNHAKLEIRVRNIGFCDQGTVVFCAEWNEFYSEDKKRFEWILKC
jgi:hypothetical protein